MSVTDPGPLVDVPQERDVVAQETVFRGRVWDVVRDTVQLGDGPAVREYVAHPGAVAVLAMDDDDRVLLQAQYRHPVRHVLWEPPAGLLDVEGEERVVAAARELAEEADLEAGRWWRLVDFFSTPGGNDERITVFLARDLRPVPAEGRYARAEEEADIVPAWVPLDDAVTAVLEGRLRCPTTVAGVLAAAAARAAGWSTLTEVHLDG
ncbi:NUDIX domain-containing protein [Cellulomonas shaoxiangyii]|uniref:NUDIX hydrolase n=1 Tax=Cellulomonas shaoxiangyii TaxID=2566013 RepID=A0A4P7SID1_9CELL|nr:NUDIX hydrolase [Cellulomonas shaoxiangyii]QCB93832.1 NUDIX hydrolase [Cellulomonas shaoxiangyii]TGY84474.1 NUDIX hydrolase [Cellulomonas shaoxiangyii]